MDPKLNKLFDDVADIKSNLREHMRRTDLAEVNIALLREEVEPLKQHVAMWAGAGKVLSVVSLIGGVIVIIVKLVVG